MFNPETFKRCRITLDWDNITLEELRSRLSYIGYHYYYDLVPEKTKVMMSPQKGFHVLLWFKELHNVAKIRDELKDDGFRLIKDINRSHRVHDVLWKEKHKGTNIFESQDLYTLRSEVRQ